MNSSDQAFYGTAAQVIAALAVVAALELHRFHGAAVRRKRRFSLLDAITFGIMLGPVPAVGLGVALFSLGDPLSAGHTGKLIVLGAAVLQVFWIVLFGTGAMIRLRMEREIEILDRRHNDPDVVAYVLERTDDT